MRKRVMNELDEARSNERPTEDEFADEGPCYLQVLEGAQQMDLRVLHHYARLGHVLDEHLRPPVLPRNASYRSAQMCSLQDG